MKKTSTKSLVAIVLVTVMFLAVLPGIRAQPPVNPVPAPCMYLVGPSGTDSQTFYTNTMGVGSTFTVTAWINTTVDEGGWSAALFFDSALLNVVSVAFTANDSSQSAWFYDQGIYAPGTGNAPFLDQVTPPSFDNTAGSIGEPGGFGELALGTTVHSASDSLFTITFKIMEVPSAGSGNYLTSQVYWDPAITRVDTTIGTADPNVSFGNFTYTLTLGEPSPSVPVPCMYLVGPSGADSQTFYTNTMGVGSTFTVTAWINTTVDEGGWSAALFFDSAQLNVVSVAFTANDSSQSAWTYDQGIYPAGGNAPYTDFIVSPTWDNIGGSIGPPGVGFGELVLGTTTVPASADSLFAITFEIMEVPPAGSFLTSQVYWDQNIAFIYDPMGAIDPNTSLGNFTYTLANAVLSSTSVVCSPPASAAGSPVTCTASVLGSNPTGTVSWSTNSSTGSFSPTVPISPGIYSTTYTDPSSGTVSITAYYSGDDYNSPSSGTAPPLVLCPTATTSTTVLDGNAYVDQSAVTGVTLSITDSQAEGASVVVTSTNYGNNQPSSVTGVLGIPGTAYYDVQVIPSVNFGSNIYAEVNFTSPNFESSDSMSYWANGGWTSVSTIFFSPYTLEGLFPLNVLTGTPIKIAPSVHDVMTMGITALKTVIGKSFLGNVTVLVANGGAYTETFNLTAYANTTAMASENVTLTPGNIAKVTLVWNTTGVAYGNYAVSACALPVPGQTNTANNNCTGRWIIVSIIGDVTGPTGWPDGKVDMRDIAVVARAFGSDGPNYLHPGSLPSSNWNANADLNNDGTVNMKDVALEARNFGQHT